MQVHVPPFRPTRVPNPTGLQTDACKPAELVSSPDSTKPSCVAAASRSVTRHVVRGAMEANPLYSWGKGLKAFARGDVGTAAKEEFEFAKGMLGMVSLLVPFVGEGRAALTAGTALSKVFGKLASGTVSNAASGIFEGCISSSRKPLKNSLESG